MTYEEDIAERTAWEEDIAGRLREAARTLLKVAEESGYNPRDPLKAAIACLRATAAGDGYESPRPARSGPQRKEMPHYIARKVFDRDDWTCQHCGTHRNLTVDHKTPLARGGSDDFDNLQTLCGSCNSSKGART